ncbi:MAG: phosphohistidine phosphatase SixA [Phycisphaerae bacterium]|nr:phosphohistidine phosphatase SixA [Phycisphaerae bacterium]
MLLYLVRHAIAVERGDSTYSDGERPLTEKGARRMCRVVRGLARLGVHLDAIWTSPLVRAIQTAEILATLPRFTGKMTVDKALAPGGDADALISDVGHSGNVGALALVGHEPDLSELCGRLITGRSESVVALRKGAVACVEIVEFEPAVRGVLQWLMQPGALRRI